MTSYLERKWNFIRCREIPEVSPYEGKNVDGLQLVGSEIVTRLAMVASQSGQAHH